MFKSVVLLLIGETIMTMISLSMNNRKMRMMTPDNTILRSDKTNIIWNLDNLTVVSWFFFQKFRMFSNIPNLQMEQKTFNIFVWNEQIIDNITQ